MRQDMRRRIARRAHRGFTLLELCFVITIITVLAAMATPVYQGYLRRSQAAEVHGMLPAIAYAEMQYFRDHGEFLSCPAQGPVPAPAALLPKQDCWETLHIKTGGPLRYRYGVEVAGETFTVIAEGDLDRDGVLARYTLNGADMSIDVVDGLE